MADTRLRALEREARTGDPQATAKLARERARVASQAGAKTHIRYWSGGPAMCLTDMANAGKRGTWCRQARMSLWDGWEKGRVREVIHAFQVALGLEVSTLFPVEQVVDVSIDTLIDIASREIMRLRAAGVPEYGTRLDIEEIRGVDAPKVTLSAGVDGVWSARASDDGVSVDDLTDRNNEPAAITTRQTHGAAYTKAAKVWSKVEKAASFHEACDILSEAGCRLHYYCRVD